MCLLSQQGSIYLLLTEELLQGRSRFQLYQRLLALAFAAVQGSGQLFFLRQYVPEYSTLWFISNVATLMAGAMVLIYVRLPTPS